MVSINSINNQIPVLLVTPINRDSILANKT
jgi:hypothetical protein